MFYKRADQTSTAHDVNVSACEQLSVVHMAKQRESQFMEGTFFTVEATGKRSYYQVTIDEFPDPDQDRALTVLYFLNVSAQYEMVAAQRQVVLKEEQNAQLKSYQAMMQHEFRTPLSASIMLITQLIGLQLCTEAMDLAQTVLGTQQLLLAVVSGLLDYRSIEAGTFAARVETFAPAQVFGLLMSIFAQDAATAGTRLFFTVLPIEQFWEAQHSSKIAVTPETTDATLPKLLSGDHTRLKQVVINLVRNALKFTVGGTVRVLVAFDDDSERLRVHV